MTSHLGGWKTGTYRAYLTYPTLVGELISPDAGAPFSNQVPDRNVVLVLGILNVLTGLLRINGERHRPLWTPGPAWAGLPTRCPGMLPTCCCQSSPRASMAKRYHSVCPCLPLRLWDAPYIA